MKKFCFEKLIKNSLEEYFNDDKLIAIHLYFMRGEDDFFILQNVDIDYLSDLNISEKQVINLVSIIKLVKKHFENEKFVLSFTESYKVNAKLYGKKLIIID